MALLSKLRVVRPCGMDWDSFSGDDKVRFCPECGKNVHNVSALTRREGAALIGDDGAVPCLRGIAAPDGTLMSIGQLANWNRRRFTQTVLASVPFAGLAMAQTGAGTLRGVVSDHFEHVLEGCSVRLMSPDGRVMTAKSKADGMFELTAVPAGKWKLRAELAGFRHFEQDSVDIREGTETQVSCHLDVGSMGGGDPEVELKLVKRKLPGKLVLRKKPRR